MSPLLSLVTAAIAGSLGAHWLVSRRWERSVALRLPLGAHGVIPGAEPTVLPGGPNAVLLLHGFGDTPQSVAGLAGVLHGEGWTVAAPLLRGHGRSLREFSRARAEDWFEDARLALAEVRRQAGSVAIVGQSMGGALAMVLAAEGGISSLVLLAPYVRVSPRAARLAQHPRLAATIMPYVTSRSSMSILDPEARRHALGFGVTTPHLLHELSRVVAEARLAAPRIEAPTLVMHSRHDPRVSVDDAESAFARLGAAEKELKWATRSGHVLAVDHDRAWVAEESRRWIAAHFPSG